MSSEHAIGPHAASFDEALVHLRFTNNIEEEHAAEVIEFCSVSSQKAPFAIICTTPDMKNVTPKARKVFADGFKELPVVAAAFVDASIRTRAIVTFVVTAINVFRSKKMLFAFFDAEGEARDWARVQLSSWTD